MAYKRKSPMPIIEGGTNASSMATTDGVVYYDGTKLVTTSAGVAGEVLTSNGPGVAPTYQVVGGGVPIKVTVYTSNDTWTKDADATKIAVIGWNGGAGGGSGRQATSTTSGGGAGGAGGGGFYFVAPANFFGATETVTIGAGGAGGAAQAGANSNGNPGSAGGQTIFGGCGTSVGTAGAAGTNGVAIGGSLTNGFIHNNDATVTSSYAVATAGSGTTTTGGTPANYGVTTSVTFASLSGGGGSGADSVTIRQAGTGAGHVYWGDAGTLLAGGTGGIESGTINGSNGNDGLTILGVPTVGAGRICGGTGGGGGGGQSAGAAAGNGGNGGFPGGGGGGGGGSLNGTSSGAGGDGGDGMVIVIEYL